MQKRQSDEQFLAVLNNVLANESVSWMSPDNTAFTTGKPIIYVVGAPRSGTTLAHQLLAACLPVGYVDNIAARFWRAPAVGLNLSRILLGEDRHKLIVYRSRLGVSEGLAGPHEFGYFWTHWMRYNDAISHHLSENEILNVDTAGLSRVLHEEILGDEGQQGFLFKNLACGFQARMLSDVHPNSLFIHLQRDEYQTAASILDWRLKTAGSYESWFSLKPSTHPIAELADDPAAQVVRQIRDIRAEMSAIFGSEGIHSLQVDYQEMCEDPMAFVADVERCLRSMGSDIRRRETVAPPFSPGRGVELPGDLQQKLTRALNV
jgi:LPS sulfotransferase NodH